MKNGIKALFGAALISCVMIGCESTQTRACPEKGNCDPSQCETANCDPSSCEEANCPLKAKACPDSAKAGACTDAAKAAACTDGAKAKACGSDCTKPCCA